MLRRCFSLEHQWVMVCTTQGCCQPASALPHSFCFLGMIISCWLHECVSRGRKMWAPVISGMSVLCVLLRWAIHSESRRQLAYGHLTRSSTALMLHVHQTKKRECDFHLLPPVFCWVKQSTSSLGGLGETGRRTFRVSKTFKKIPVPGPYSRAGALVFFLSSLSTFNEQPSLRSTELVHQGPSRGNRAWRGWQIASGSHGLLASVRLSVCLSSHRLWNPWAPEPWCWYLNSQCLQLQMFDEGKKLGRKGEPTSLFLLLCKISPRTIIAKINLLWTFLPQNYSLSIRFPKRMTHSFLEKLHESESHQIHSPKTLPELIQLF